MPLRRLSQCVQGDAGGGGRDAQREATGDHDPRNAADSSTSEPHKEESVLYGIVGETLKAVARRVPVDEPPPLPENARLDVIGKASPRLDAVQKVTGRARYTFDVQLPGMLHGCSVVSAVAHARIKSIDTTRGGTSPGRARRACSGSCHDDGAAARPGRRGQRALSDREVCRPAHCRRRRGNRARRARGCAAGAYRVRALCRTSRLSSRRCSRMRPRSSRARPSRRRQPAAAGR